MSANSPAATRISSLAWGPSATVIAWAASSCLPCARRSTDSFRSGCRFAGTAQIGSCQVSELPIALTCWRCENFTGSTIAAGSMSGAEVENSHNPASMPTMFHSPVAIDCTVCSFCPANGSPRKPVRASARTEAFTSGIPADVRMLPFNRCAIWPSIGAVDTSAATMTRNRARCIARLNTRATVNVYRVNPGPRTGWPGRSLVIFPPETTALPLTSTCSTPSE